MSKNVLERMKENDSEHKIAMFKVKQQQDYTFKRKYARIRAWEFYNHPEIDGMAYVAVGGLDTVALEAMKAGRRGYTIELNNSYFRDAVGYLKAEEENLETPTLFDMLGGA